MWPRRIPACRQAPMGFRKSTASIIIICNRMACRSGPSPVLGSLGSGCNPPDGLNAEPSKSNKDEATVPEVQQMSLPLWCSLLTSQVLRSRSGFSAYLAKAIQLSRGRPTRGSSAPTFFPIPLPVIGCF